MTVALMALVVVCGTHTGVDTCLTQADVVNKYHDRAACIARGKEMVADATLAYSYGHVVGPYRVKIRCLPTKPSLEPAVKGKPDYTGTANGPSAKSAPAPKEPVAPERPWYWPFPPLSWWPF